MPEVIKIGRFTCLISKIAKAKAQAEGLEDDEAHVDDIYEEEEEEEDEKAGVPVTICIVTIFLYMLAGANMYQAVEHWDLLSCLYHAYVTMATIGLGDYYPGKNVDIRETGIRVYLGVTGIYMTIGMVIISMCFTLISEEAAGKFKFWAKKVSYYEVTLLIAYSHCRIL